MADGKNPATRTAYIALGSNLGSELGSPRQILRAAVDRLNRLDRLNGLGRLTAQSSLYETDPAGYHDQPVFLNAVLALETGLDPEELLRRMLAIEREFGRERKAALPKGPRTLDLDLLLIDDLTIEVPGLTLPHPLLARRRFVLTPLAEIAPGLCHPLLHRTIAELLAQLPNEGDNSIRRTRKAAASF